MAKIKVCGIYKITSPTGRVYIGQSVNIHKRWADYRCLHNCSEQRRLYNSFKKHGVLSHNFEIIEVCTTDIINDREKYYVELLDCVKHGLNIKAGGFGKIHNAETIEKLRQKNIGKKMSAKSRAKMSASKKGHTPWNKGKTGIFSNEAIESNRQKHIGLPSWNKGLTYKTKKSA